MQSLLILDLVTLGSPVAMLHLEDRNYECECQWCECLRWRDIPRNHCFNFGIFSEMEDEYEGEHDFIFVFY